MVGIDTFPDRQKEVGSTLRLVDHGAIQAVHEAGRIGAGRGERRRIVERQMSAVVARARWPTGGSSCRPGADRPGGRRAVLQGLPDAIFDVA